MAPHALAGAATQPMARALSTKIVIASAPKGSSGHTDAASGACTVRGDDRRVHRLRHRGALPGYCAVCGIRRIRLRVKPPSTVSSAPLV